LYARLVKLSPTGQLLDEWHPFKVTSTGPFGAEGPTLLAVDQQGDIYVADATDDTVKKLSASGQVLVIWGRSGSAPGQFNLPEGVAIDPQGNVYVSDNSNSRIEKFSSDGKFLAAWGTQGNAPGQFNFPFGVAVDARGNIYVADSRNERIVKLSPAGKVLTIWDRSPNVVGSLAVDTQGNLYVTEDPLFSGHVPVQLEKFSATGKTISVWKGLCTG
jgi:DNA-binding beta-propeller fold protein YncE